MEERNGVQSRLGTIDCALESGAGTGKPNVGRLAWEYRRRHCDERALEEYEFNLDGLALM